MGQLKEFVDMTDLKRLGLAAFCFIGFACAFQAHCQSYYRYRLPGLFQGLSIGVAQNSWRYISPDVQSCLGSRFRLFSVPLGQQGIFPTDPRVAGAVAWCRQYIQQAIAQQQAAIRQQELAPQRPLSTNSDGQATPSYAPPRPTWTQQRAQQQAVDQSSREQEARAAAQAAAASAARQKAIQASAAAEVAAEKQQAEADKIRHASLIAKYGAKHADAIVARQALPGMTTAEVIAALGEPSNREVIPPNDELWHYATQQITVIDGKVSYVGR
jgi:hypothetical protein